MIGFPTDPPAAAPAQLQALQLMQPMYLSSAAARRHGDQQGIESSAAQFRGQPAPIAIYLLDEFPFGVAH